jgi:DNA-binding PadR family transcriptional regulator
MILGLLDLYVLSLVDRGMETPYSLHREGGLSLGASTPSLRRLTEIRLVKRKEGEGATNRPRHVYTLTSAGQELARTGWQEHLHGRHIPSDLDAILRLADMAIHYGANPREVADFLKLASDERKAFGQRAAAHVVETTRVVSYQQMRSRCEAARLRAEAVVLSDLSTLIATHRNRHSNSLAKHPISASKLARKATTDKIRRNDLD